MATKPSQYKIVRNGIGWGIVGRFTGRWVSSISTSMTKKEAKAAIEDLEKYTHDTPQSFQGYYGG